jgi:hypothetical protein
LTIIEKYYRIFVMKIEFNQLIYLFILFLFSCNNQKLIENKIFKNHNENITDINFDYLEDEKIILDYILQQLPAGKLVLINRNYSFFDDSDEILTEYDESMIFLKNIYERIYKKEIKYPYKSNDMIRDFLEFENIENDLIMIFIKNRKNKKVITIPINHNYQFFDDDSEIKAKKFPEKNDIHISMETEYVIIEISNICFNEEMNKAIVHLFIEYGTFPFSFIYTKSCYIIFEKNKEVIHKV